MSPLFYQILHVLSAMLLVGFVISACADPRPERKKSIMIITGVLSLLVLVGGFGLAMKIHGISNPLKFTGWMVAKVVIWLLLSGMAGLAFRRSTIAGVLTLVTIALAGGAVYLVYARPVIFGI
ncbi:MAG: hypothetical protein IAE82_02350 [Opitutaceae bacterium]|nr:hypothetical protein [Opitutaceae bacterium]